MADFAALLRAAADAHKLPSPSKVYPLPAPSAAAGSVSCPITATISLPALASSNKLIASSPSRIWSDEQEEALAINDPRLLISALAGTGKTSVLLEYARRRSQKSWTLLTLNASVAKDIASRAPPGLSVRTFHSMAFARHGAPIASKLLPDMPSWSRVSSHVSLPWANRHRLRSAVLNAYGRTLIDGLIHFSHNSDALLSFDVCNPLAWNDLMDRYPDVSWDRVGWCEDAVSVWRAMLNPGTSCPTGHDVYLKRFCLAGDSWPKSYWLLDEAQDWSDGVRMAWDKNVDHGVRAGDPFQAIYTWRTEAACPWDFPGEKVVWLHQSRRQGLDVSPWINGQLFALTTSHRWMGESGLITKIRHDPETVEGLASVRPNMVLSGHWSALAVLAPMLISAGLSPVWSSGVPEAVRRDLPNIPVSGEVPGPSLATVQASSVLLSTIHAAKGSECDRVWIVDNALSAHTRPSDLAMPNRLAYVALTRGRSVVRIPLHWKKAMKIDDQASDDPFQS